LRIRPPALAAAGALTLAGLSSLVAGPASAAPKSSYVGHLGTPRVIGSTVPANGDVNPYGVAVVGTTTGHLVAGDVLVSNFNAKSNVQGTGSTLVEVSPHGGTQLFASLSSGTTGNSNAGDVGLTTALAILPGGWVIVGDLPTTKGGALPSGDPVGSLLILNSDGHLVETISNKDIVGPWDLVSTATASSATLYVSNALGGNTQTLNGSPVAGNCTVVRVDLTLSGAAPPKVTSTTVIGTDFPWKANSTALVLAPTGLAIGHRGTLYVDDSQTNTVSAIPHARTRTTSLSAQATTIAQGGALNAPLGMTRAPNGDLLVVNGNDGNIVEITPRGHQLATRTLVHNGGGDLFGLAPAPGRAGLYLVNDGTNTLEEAPTTPAA
jgi:hypothetical protein